MQHEFQAVGRLLGFAVENKCSINREWTIYHTHSFKQGQRLSEGIQQYQDYDGILIIDLWYKVYLVLALMA